MRYLVLSFKFDELNDWAESLLMNETKALGTEQDDQFVKIFYNAEDFNRIQIESLLKQIPELNPVFEIDYLPEINWNARWEADYEPVFIEDKLVIRAPFYNSFDDFPFNITLEPEMAFGTGHHETTSLMLLAILKENMKNASVLDFGSGTGVLAILAAKMGATNIYAIDNDENSINSIIKNTANNKVEVETKLSSKPEVIHNMLFDYLFANITKTVLLDNMQSFSHLTKSGSKLILSGFYNSDAEEIITNAESVGFRFDRKDEKNNWAALTFEKE